MTEPSIRPSRSSSPSRPPTGSGTGGAPRARFDDAPNTGHRCPVQRTAAVAGAVFLVVGLAGFVPGITDDVGEIEFAGHASATRLLGVFQVSVLHNLIHLMFGVAGLAAARRAPAARSYLVGGGVIYLLLFLYGFLIDADADANVIPVNAADDWLHLGLGAVMVLSGIALWRHRTHDAYTSRAAGTSVGERPGRSV